MQNTNKKRNIMIAIMQQLICEPNQQKRSIAYHNRVTWFLSSAFDEFVSQNLNTHKKTYGYWLANQVPIATQQQFKAFEETLSAKLEASNLPNF